MKMERSIDFFKDEVRNGFYIPTAIKQAWAAELDVLEVIDNICQKHNIKYFADWGTFLGAVRHGGFVPWDDDLDIAMLRPDYDRFRKVVDSELPEGFVIHDFSRKENHWLFLMRVVNNEKMCFTEEYLEKHNNFPWLAGVDIFVKDYLYRDEEKEKRRDKSIMNILAVADAVTEGKIYPQILSSQLNDIKKRYRISLPGKYRKRDISIALYKLADELMARTKYDEADKIGQIFPWILKNGVGVAEDKEKYERTIRLPFEDTTIPVPVAYIDTLSFRYRKYFELHKVWKGHEYPFFEGQKQEIEKLSGQLFNSFTYEEDMKNRAVIDMSNSLKNTCEECIEEFQRIIAGAEKFLSINDFDGYVQMVSDSQQLAADLGSLVEVTKGEECLYTKNVIDELQQYCDALWMEYQRVLNGEELKSMAQSRKALDRVIEALQENIINRHEILFLPVGFKEWHSMERYYKKELAESDCDIFVVPLPMMKKTVFGDIKMTDDEIDKSVGLDNYPKEINYTDWLTYNISVHCPEKVYIQNPYDGENPCLTVPTEFYSKNIQAYTKELIYIPIAKTAEFSADDRNDRYNMQHYVVAPGIIFSDKVLVQSENIRNQYIDVLTEFGGKNTRTLWEKKIKVEELLEENTQSDRRTILFCIGANELSEQREKFVVNLEKRLKSICDGDLGEVHTALFFYPDDKEQWINVDKEKACEVYEIVDKAQKVNKVEVEHILPIEADNVAEKYDAYYGSPSPLMPAFLIQNKPVMIANYSV